MAEPEKASSAVPRLDFVLAADAQPCGRCGEDALLVGDLTSGQLETSGKLAHASRRVVLCGRCDQNDAEAGALITFFAVHGEITLPTADEFVALVRAWAASVQTPEVDMAALERDVEAWHRGEFDDYEPPPGPYLPGDERLDWPDDTSEC